MKLMIKFIKRVIFIEELLIKAKEGDIEACEELFRSVYSYLIKYARKKLHNEDDIQDAVQNTLELAYKSFHSVEHNENFKTWITAILKNECYKIYNKKSNKETHVNDVINYRDNIENVESAVNFQNIISKLKAEDERIYNLYYEDKLTIKQISILLDMNENTVKSRLKRGKQTLRSKIKRSTLILILCLLITTGIIAVCAISYIKSLFALNSVGKDNRSVLMAIENSEWFQQTNMDYISIDDKNKIRLDYLLMDEMNLYMVFDFKTEDDISKFTDIGLLGLKIENESGDIICDNENVLSPQYRKSMGNKVIESTSNSMKFLVYLYTDNFPMSNTLNIHFSKITLAKKLSIKHSLYSDVSLDVSLDEKFTNRHSVYLHSDSKKIYKSIITETGFYCILDLEYGQTIKKAKLFDQNNNSYDCYFTQLTSTGSYSTLQYIIISNFNNKDANNLKLVIDNNEYFLTNT